MENEKQEIKEREEKLKTMLTDAKKVPGLEIALSALQLERPELINYSRMSGFYAPEADLVDLYVDPKEQLGIFSFYKASNEPDYSTTVFGLYHKGVTQLSIEIKTGRWNQPIDKIHRVVLGEEGLEKTVRVLALNKERSESLNESISKNIHPCYTLKGAEITYDLNRRWDPAASVKRRLAIEYCPEADPKLVKDTIKSCEDLEVDTSEY